MFGELEERPSARRMPTTTTSDLGLERGRVLNEMSPCVISSSQVSDVLSYVLGDRWDDEEALSESWRSKAVSWAQQSVVVVVVAALAA